MKFKIWLSNNFSHATSQNGEIDNFNLESFLTILENSYTVVLNPYPKLYKIYLFIIVFITAENMSCIHTKQ